MNRRELLKFSLFSPLLGLIKKKPVEKTSELTLDMILKCKEDIDSETTGASTDGPVGYYDGKWIWIKWMPSDVDLGAMGKNE